MRRLWTLALAGAMGWTSICAARIVVNDDRGNVVALDASAERVVTLAPFLTELWFAAGAGDRVVGVSSYSDHPEPARAIPRVSAASTIDYERLLALQPDLVVAWRSGNGERAIDRLEQLGLTVYVAEPRRLSDVTRTLRVFGALAGQPGRAQIAASQFERRIAALRAHYAGKRAVSVFYEISHHPLMTLNGTHMVTAVIELCGGRNVFAAAPVLAPTVSLEQVVERDPEVIVLSSAMADIASVDAGWRSIGALTAVRHGDVFVIDASLLERQTPRLADGAQRLCELLDGVRARH